MPIITLEQFLKFCNEHPNEKEMLVTKFIEFSKRNEKEAIKFLNLPESYYLIDLNKYPGTTKYVSNKLNHYLFPRSTYQHLKEEYERVKKEASPQISSIIATFTDSQKKEKFDFFNENNVKKSSDYYIENPAERIFLFFLYHPHYFSNEHKDKIKLVVNIEDFNLPEEIYYFARNLIILSEVYEKDLLNIYFNAVFEEILPEEINFNNYFNGINPKANFLEILNAYKEKNDKNLDNWYAYTYASLLYSKQIPNVIKTEKNYEEAINRLQVLFDNEQKQKEVNNEQNNTQNVPPLESVESCLIA